MLCDNTKTEQYVGVKRFIPHSHEPTMRPYPSLPPSLPPRLSPTVLLSTSQSLVMAFSSLFSWAALNCAALLRPLTALSRQLIGRSRPPCERRREALQKPAAHHLFSSGKWQASTIAATQVERFTEPVGSGSFRSKCFFFFYFFFFFFLKMSDSFCFSLIQSSFFNRLVSDR